MFTSAFGEVITDILTINPAIRQISSASAILDVSNFCIQAMTLGKDAEGFKYHSHTIHSVNDLLEPILYNDGNLIITVYNTQSPSSYHSSATHAQFSSIYNSIPCYPSVYDTRLERKSTYTNVSSFDAYFSNQNLGHYLNPAVRTEFNSYWNVVGGYAPSSGGTYIIYNSASSFVYSGTLSGYWNTYGLMDSSGFIKLSDLNGSAAKANTSWSGGPKVTASSVELEQGIIEIAVCIQLGDAATLAAFGGVNHFGFYCLDIKEMLKNGLTPPYNWNHLNNTRKYKLVAKASFWRDVLFHHDESGLPGYRYLMVQGTNDINPINYGPGFIFSINFV